MLTSLTPELLEQYPTGVSSISHSRGLSARFLELYRVEVYGLVDALVRVAPPCVAPCPVLRPDLASAMLPLVNADRAQTGGGPLYIDSRLTACEEWKVLNLAANLYLNHDDEAPPLNRPWYLRFADYYPSGYGFGENLAYGFVDPALVMQAFLSDSGHKGNVENPSWRGVGLAVAQASNGLLFWGQGFGAADPGSAPPPPVPSPVVLDRWMTEVLPKLQATSQYVKWRAAKTSQSDVGKWDVYLTNPRGAVPTMKTPYGKLLVADLHLAATS